MNYFEKQNEEDEEVPENKKCFLIEEQTKKLIAVFGIRRSFKTWLH